MRTSPATGGTFVRREGRPAIAGLVHMSILEFGGHLLSAVEDAFWHQKHDFATFWANVMHFVQVGRVPQ